MKRLNEFISLTPFKMREGFAAIGGLRGLKFRQQNLPDGANGLAVSGTNQADVDASKPPGWGLAEWRDFCTGILVSLQKNSKTPTGAGEGLVQLWGLSGFWADGIRAYNPTRDEFLALSQVEVRIPWSEYRQPFETFAVAVPEGVFDRPLSDDIGLPACCISRVSQDLRTASFVMPSVSGGRLRGDLICSHWWQPGDDRPIDEYLADLPSADDLNGTESNASEIIKRVAINANLLLSSTGARAIGPVNPEYAARLRDSLAKKKLPDAVRRANESALKAIPVLYGFDQRVRVYEQEGRGHANGAGGWAVRPHWRRGHWARLACGAGRKERRLVFRPAVMVHAECFAGHPSDARVTYTT